MWKFLLIVTSVMLHVAAFSQDNKEELERKRKQTLQEIDVLNRQYNEIKKNKKVSLSQLAVVQRKIELRNQVIADINRQVNVIDKNINTSYHEMKILEGNLDTLKKNYAQNIVYAYKNRSSYDFLNFLFSAANFNDAVQRISYMRAYRNYRAQQFDAIIKTEELYKQKITQLTNNKKEKNAVLSDQTKEMSELVKDKEEQNLVVNEMKKKEGEISKSLAAKKKQAITLNNAITAIVKRIAKEEEEKRRLAVKKAVEEKKRLEDDEKRKAAEKVNNVKTNPVVKSAKTNPTTAPAKAKTNEPTTKPEKDIQKNTYDELNKADIALGASFESNRGRLPWPVDNGFISTPFGTSKVLGVEWNQDWITISSAVGSPVRCVFDGEVNSVSDQNGVTSIAIKHGNYVTMYSNIKSVSVSRGQQVTRGTVIGRVDENLDGDGTIEFILINLKTSKNMNPSSWLRPR